MLNQICEEIHNYFSLPIDKCYGKFEITDGVITPPISILPNQYYRIVGSVFNDGVHKYGDIEDVLVDEPQFEGAIWLMRVPQDIINLVNEIKQWQDKYGGVDSPAMSPYQSESFGGYSYSKMSGVGNNNTNVYDWRSVFGPRLNKYRKIN